MKSLRERQSTQYLSHKNMGDIVKTNNPRLKTSFVASIATILATVFLLTAVLSMFSATSSTAFADKKDDDEKSQEKIKELSEDYIVDKDDGDPFWGTVDKFDKEDNPASKKTFGSVMSRLFSTQYMNDTSKGSAQVGMENGINGSGRNCDVNAKGNGTLIYHNCDVPNIATELIQDAASLLMESGVKGGEVQKASSAWSSIGLPSKIPAKGAPVKPAERSVKYTALELYGYNLRYTSYGGEWDHIKVMTTARAMANFGWMDNIKMSVTAVFEGVATGMEVASDNFTDEISTGNVFGAIGGFFSGLVEGSAAGGIHSILDTSDLNVFNTYAWYRVGYGGTLYNARELTGAEVAAKARAEMLDMITSGRPDEAKVPEDLEKVKKGPDDIKENISKCVHLRGKLDNVEWGSGKKAPGVTKEKCQEAATKKYKIRQAGDNPPKGDNDKIKWTKDGNQKKESVKDWRKRNKQISKIAQKYGINCKEEVTEENRKTTIPKLKACWPEQYAGAEEDALKSNQTNMNEEWVKKLLGPDALQKWIAADPSRNFNAPWNRFVCTTDGGKDKKKDGKLIMLYDSNGKLNEDCRQVRPPIQNGLFGNGYLSDQTQPGIDTRNDLSSESFLSLLVPMDSVSTTIANLGLAGASFLTRVSNTVINLTFSPVFETLGIDKVVVKLIKEFRDSIFFPLLALMVAVTGIMALWSAGKNRDYKRQFTAILIMTGVIMSGVFLMYKPEMTLKMVDEVPAEIEKAIMGTIFTVGNGTGDQLCTSTGTVKGEKSKGLDGKTLNYNPNDSARTLMCENWRAFAFNPWVYGQWGTDFSNLDNKDMNNTNDELVGEGSVKMGGGKTVKNWALYQLDVMSSGTASKTDPDRPTGRTDKNIYRIVDMQAGPNNGEGTDPRYFESWAGTDWGERLVIGLFSPIVALFGAITVIVYSITKIQIAFATVIMLIFLPIIFLFGIHPRMGLMKLKGYVGTILGLMAQRVVLVLVMAVMFRVVIGFTTSSGSYLINAIAACAACVAFLMMRKQFLDLIFSSISAKLGEPVGGQFVQDPEKWQRDKVIKPNGFIANKAAVVAKGTQSIAAGSIAGYMAGGRVGAVKNAKQAFTIEKSNLLNRQRRRGYGPLQSIVESAGAGKKAANEQIMNLDEAQKIERELVKDSPRYKRYQRDLAKYEAFEGEEFVEDKVKFKRNAEGVVMEEPKAPTKLVSRDSASTSRNIKKRIEQNRALDRLSDRYHKEYYEDEEAREEYMDRKAEFYKSREYREQEIEDRKNGRKKPQDQDVNNEQENSENNEQETPAKESDFMYDVANDNKYKKENEVDEKKAAVDYVEDKRDEMNKLNKQSLILNEKLHSKADYKDKITEFMSKAERSERRKARLIEKEKEQQEEQDRLNNNEQNNDKNKEENNKGDEK